MNEVTVKESTIALVDYKTKALDYLSSMGNKLPAKHQTQFIEMAQAFGLNPFKREIYAVGYGENWNIITGYEVYIKRAERTGKLNGWKVSVNGKGEDMTATVTIYRKDWEFPFEHTVLFSEVCQKTKDGRLNSVWGKMPSFMTKKVAIAQGFRLCFSDELSGMPYTADEMPGEEELKNVTPEEVKPAADVKNSKPKQEKKYTKEQGLKLKPIIEASLPDGTNVFSDEEKQSYRNLLIAGQFDLAFQQATEIKNKRLEAFSAEDVEVEIVADDEEKEDIEIPEGIF